MYIIFNESNPLDPRKDVVHDDIVDDFFEMCIEKKEDPKPLELKGPSKDEVQEAP